MAQQQSEASAVTDTAKELDTAQDTAQEVLANQEPKIEIELIRRPYENGIFGTVSFKVSVSGVDPDDTLRALENMTNKMETRYGARRVQHVNIPQS